METLPKNWAKINLDNLFNLTYGKGISMKDLIDNTDNKDALYNVYGANGIIGKYNKYTYKNSKVIISCRGAASGTIHKTVSFSFISSNSIVLDEIDEKLINLDFIKYVMTYIDKSEVITGTAQPQITIQLLKFLEIPLPPLPEQERIVAKLDALFEQHEVMKKALERIPQLLKDFRQQVLTHAVTGKLTEKWREKTNNLVEWELKKLDEISLSITDGDHQAPPKSESGVPFLVISNISDGKLNFNHISRYVPINYYEKLKDIRKPNTGDILYTVTGSYGIPVLVNEKIDFCFQRHIAIIKPDPQKVYNIFLYYYLKSQNILEQAKECATGTAQLTVPLSGLRKFILKVPTILEQHEIINRIENLFTKADIIEERYKNLKEKIDSLPQAILHKAFKGELVPQLPSDGDAKDLLEEILKLKKEIKKK